MCTLIFPLSLLKELKSLTYVCLFSFVVTIYLTLVVFSEAFNGKLNGFDFKSNIKEVKLFDIKGM
jgi:hypothetical protein